MYISIDTNHHSPHYPNSAKPVLIQEKLTMVCRSWLESVRGQVFEQARMQGVFRVQLCFRVPKLEKFHRVHAQSKASTQTFFFHLHQHPYHNIQAAQAKVCIHGSKAWPRSPNCAAGSATTASASSDFHNLPSSTSFRSLPLPLPHLPTFSRVSPP